MKLLTKAIADKLRKVDREYVESRRRRPVSTKTPDEVIVKFFTPWANATWWIVQGTPLNNDGEPDYATQNPADWHMFGFCDLGDAQCAELGYVLLSDLESLSGPAGLKVERDAYYNGETLSEVLKRYERLAAHG